MRLRRSLKLVPVIDSDGSPLYEVDRQIANDHLNSGRAINVKGRAICMRSLPSASEDQGSHPRLRGQSCSVGDRLMTRYVLATNSDTDQTAVEIIDSPEGWRGRRSRGRTDA